MTTKICRDCGAEFEPYGKPSALSNRKCPACAQAERRREYESRKSNMPQRADPSVRQPVIIVDIIRPATADTWNEFPMIRGNRFPADMFAPSMRDGDWDGYVVDHGGQRYMVSGGRMEAVND